MLSGVAIMQNNSRGNLHNYSIYLPELVENYVLQASKEDNGDIFQLLWKYYGGEIEYIEK